MKTYAVVSSAAIETPPLSYGGLERVAALRARKLAEDGYKVVLIGKRGSAISWRAVYGRPPDNLTIYEFGSEEEFLRAAATLEAADAIIDDSWGGYVYERFPEKTIKVWHAPLPPRMLELRSGYAVSRAHMDYARARGAALRGFIHNIIDVDEFSGEARDEGYFLYMNRISAEKGALEFVRLCCELGAKCVMIGEDFLVQDREYVHIVMNEAQRCGVAYLGRAGSAERLRYLRNCRAVVAPLSKDYFEVFGLYVVEAFAYGKPVVAYENGALREVSLGRALLARTREELKELMKSAEPSDALREVALKYDYRRWNPII